MSAKEESEFVRWEDLDLGSLLGEYTDVDEDISSQSGSDSSNEELPRPTPSQSVNIGKPASALYQCPECSRLYKSVAGFRGHITKKHNMPHERGQYTYLVDIFLNATNN